jgi:lipopolysaccharide transport system ATP-binding protein
MSAPAIRVEGMGKRYRLGEQRSFGSLRESLVGRLRSLGRPRPGPEKASIWALRDVSFEITPGEAVGIIGRNGAGKTTLLKLLSRITEPTTGRAEIRGRVGSLLEVGTGFHPELTGRENIALNGAILGMRRAEIAAKFDEIVSFAEVEKFIDTPVKRYSSGMYLRLAFAVAAHLETEILLVDEVLAVGDLAFQRKCLGKMGDVTHRGRTVLFVSHNMAAINSLCRRALWVDAGCVRSDGRAATVVAQYLSDQRGAETEVIEPDAHAHEPDGLTFVSLHVLDEADEPTSRILFGEVLHLRIRFSVARSLAAVRLMVVVLRLDGTLVTTLHHTDDERHGPLRVGPGDYVAEVSSAVRLMPGAYALSLAAKPDPGYFGSGDPSLDYVEVARIIHIEAIARDGSGPLASGAPVHVDSTWSFTAHPE